MLLNQETLRLVFGLKLRGLRQDRGYSLKDLAKKTGLSPSYLNEIEKGKKYPKIEKILILAEALNEKMESLISLELKKDLKLLQNLIDKNLLTGLPFDIFGIPTITLVELLSEHPKKMQALFGTIIEIARGHNIEVDDLFFALLRSYQDMHNNYFPHLEAAAEKARIEFSIKYDANLEQIKEKLTVTLQQVYQVNLKYLNFADLDLLEIDHFTLKNGKLLNISSLLDLKSQIFVLARELGYQFLKTKVRPPSSLISQLDSFEQLFNYFSASYFASSLLIPEVALKVPLNDFINQPLWSAEAFNSLIKKFPCPIESVFHRMTQILPRHFNLGNLFFLKYEFDPTTQRYQVERELHLSSPHSAFKIKAQEHYCSRWLVHRLTQEKTNNPFLEMATGAQRSRFNESGNEYLILATSFKKEESLNKITCVCLGLFKNEELAKKVHFLNDPAIRSLEVGETCQRCTLVGCNERRAPYDHDLNPHRYQKVFDKIQQLSKSLLD